VAEHQVESCAGRLNSYSCDFVSQVHVRLASGHVLDVLGVGHHDRAGGFQNLVHGFPILATRFHRHMRDPMSQQPIGQGEQILGQRAKGTGLPLGAAVGPGVSTQATTVRLWTSRPAHDGNTTSITYLLLRNGLAGYLGEENFPCVLARRAPRRTLCCAVQYPDPFLVQAHGTTDCDDLDASPWRHPTTFSSGDVRVAHGVSCGHPSQRNACTPPAYITSPCVRAGWQDASG
jgi:hypothetical protein